MAPRPGSFEDDTERVTCRVREDAPTALPVTAVNEGGPETEDLFLGLVEVPDRHVEVELLGPGRIGPARRPMVFHALEGEHQPGGDVQRRPAVAEGPPRIRLVHHAAEK